MPNKDILFSIISPTYNRKTFIEKTIRSILAQTYPHFEIIIVDDGSRDNTKTVVKAIGDKRITYYRQENGERGAARNFGIARANGDFVTFIDSDDVLYPNHFEEAINLLKTNPMAEVFHLAYEVRDTDANLLSTTKHWRNLNEQLIRGNVVSCIGIFIKQGLLAGDLLFSENKTLSGTEDWLLWLRFAARHKFYYSNTITACMINHAGRSVLNSDEQAMLTRTNLLMQGLRSDDRFMVVYGHYLGRIEAHMLSYTALHLQLRKNKNDALAYLIKAVKLDARELFTRRSLAILKHQLL
jgi:glycosyltransferase involved in cell wall biosynthesis